MGNFLSKDKFKIIGSQFRWNISELAQADARVDLLIHLSSILEKVSNDEVLEISYKTSSAKALIINQAVQAILRVLLIYDTGGTEAGVTPSSSSATLLPSLSSISRPFLSLSSLPYLFPCPFFPAPPSPLLFPPPCPLVQLRGLKRIVRSPSGVPAANTCLTILTPENMSADNTLLTVFAIFSHLKWFGYIHCDITLSFLIVSDAGRCLFRELCLSWHSVHASSAASSPKWNNVRDPYELPDFCPLNSLMTQHSWLKSGAISLPEKSAGCEWFEAASD